MKIAVTGATGFLGRYIVNHLLAAGHDCRGTYRPDVSDTGGFNEEAKGNLEWVPFELNDQECCDALTQGCDAVVHGALYRPGAGFRGAEGNLLEFVDKNVMGSLRLMETSIRKEVGRFVFISTCAVHEIILDDRPLDEAHPLWATNHYGAHKAAIEKFVHSYGFGKDYPICSLRPTGICGLARPANTSKWFDIVQAVKQGKPIESKKGGKEVHAADVAKAVEILLQAQGIAGQAYNCYDRYISDEQVARVAKEITGSDSSISDLNKGPKNQISTEKIRRLGMEFGGETLLRKTVEQMLEAG